MRRPSVALVLLALCAVALGTAAPAAQIHLSDVKFFAGASASASSGLQTLAFPKGLAKPAAAGASDVVEISFKVVNTASKTPIAAHQVVVEFASASSGVISYPVTGGEAGYSFKIATDEEAASFDWRSGSYSVRILVGDFKTQPLTYNVGSISLSFSEKTQNMGDQDTFTPKPLIEHQFRAPAARAPAFIAVVFSGAVFACFGAFILALGKVGANVSMLDATAMTSAIGFHGGLAAIFGVYGLFWLSLNIFETLFYLIAPVIVTFFFGKRLLSYMATKQ